MNIIKAILVLSLFIPYNAFAACGGSSPNFVAASASRQDVGDCIACATYGDTITVPAGNKTWTSGLEITKDIKIIGSGIDSTILSMGFADDRRYDAFFVFKPDATSCSRLNQLNGDGTFEVSGFTFAGNNCMMLKFGIRIDNKYTTVIRRIKIHHNKLTKIYRAISPSGEVYGVFYSNELIDSGACKPLGLCLTSWNNNPMTLGSGDGWYVEDNTFSFSPPISGGSFLITSGGQGMGQVIRYNTVTGSAQMYVDAHGNQTSGVKSTQITEVYGNSLGATCNQAGIDMRGGKCMIFFNALGDKRVQIRQEYKDAASGTLPANACPEAGPQICDDDCVCMKVNHSYFFNNRAISDSSIVLFPVTQDKYDRVHDNVPPELVENREFWNHNESFNGTTGIGCGPLANMPATCTVGVGYWATNQDCSSLSSDNIGANPTTPISGTLYRCTAPNTWTEFYTPYTYPHPLNTGTPSTPSGLQRESVGGQ